MPADEARAARYAGYAQARLRIPDLAGRALVLRPRTDCRCEGPFPLDGVAHVLTAHDPGPEHLAPEENARRQRALVADLPGAAPRWEAVAGAEDGSHTEASVVVVGLTDDAALALARRWGQDAIFRWTAEAWSILPCDDAAPVHLGWSVTASDR